MTPAVARTGRPLPAALCILLAATSAGCEPFDVCDPPAADALAAAPQRLSQTGLDGPDVVPFAPRFELWSDGAEKQRWIRLPPGGQIDRSDMDDWQFPPGTRLWKQFARDGVPIETRMLEKLAPAADAWLMVAYVWDEDGRDATITPDGMSDANGTTHDVPSAAECRGCHDGRQSRVLGYSAIQLDTDLAIPGTEVEQAALGYLHANCSHCHNAARPPRTGSRCYDPQNDLDFRLLTATLATVDRTPTYQTAVGGVVEPSEPDQSALFVRICRRDEGQMPPLGTELVDSAGAELIKRWIEELR
ncbi:MAG TPA: hypothetical protein VFU21_30215 [Kofleriaceae bacterium]|nr:hypothetical protein [Kofleriaceae bacterium]